MPLSWTPRISISTTFEAQSTLTSGKLFIETLILPDFRRGSKSSDEKFDCDFFILSWLEMPLNKRIILATQKITLFSRKFFLLLAKSLPLARAYAVCLY